MNENNLIQGLYGSYISTGKMVGYCHHHCAALTVKTMKRHECLRKQCNSFEKQSAHDFLRQHEQKKAWRKSSKGGLE